MKAFTALDVRDYLEHLGFMPRLPSGSSTYLFLSGAAIDGASSATGNVLKLNEVAPREDYYDDVCLTFTMGLQSLSANKGTSDPGSYHYHRQGRANLVRCHPHRFVRGKHYGNGQDVLRPENGNNRYWRDADGDARQDADEGVRGGNGSMLIHAMGGDRIQRWGAGCLGIWDSRNYHGADWRAWRDQAYSTCDQVSAVQVVIMPALDFARFLESGGMDHRPTLWPGASGFWVERLQLQLNSWAGDSRPHLAVDGDFGSGTRQRVLAFQAESALTDDAIVGARTWTGLEPWRD